MHPNRRHRLRFKRAYRPIAVCVVNLAFPMGDRRGERILERAAQLAPIIIAVEAKAVDGLREDGSPVLDPARWVVVHDDSDPARAGNLLAFRRDRCRALVTRVRVGTTPMLYVRGGRVRFDILTRYVTKVVVLIDGGTSSQRVRSFAAAHFPPKRAWALWNGMARSVRKVDADVTGGDFNKHRGVVASEFPLRTVRMVELIGLMARKPLLVGRATPHDVGSDHPAVVVYVR